MSDANNPINIPQARKVMDRFKMQAVLELVYSAYSDL